VEQLRPQEVVPGKERLRSVVNVLVRVSQSLGERVAEEGIPCEVDDE